MKFKFLTGDINWLQYGAKWISPKLNNGDFDYWIVLELINFMDATGELYNKKHKYVVELTAVSPQEAGKDNLEKAFGCCGIDEEVHKINDLIKVEALSSYGIVSHLYSNSGNNANKLIKEAKKEAQLREGMFGFFMDGPQNKIGTTGWEAIRGDLNAALDRCAVSDDPAKKLVAKISGRVAV